jgi:hypothetical protein
VNAITVVLVLLIASVTMAADECFCLRHEKDDFFRHSCSTQQQGLQTKYHCLDAEGKSYSFDSLSGWSKLDAGANGCNPCQRAGINLDGDIRGNGKSQPPKEISNDRNQ